jgi:hypothetical protein
VQAGSDLTLEVDGKLPLVAELAGAIADCDRGSEVDCASFFGRRGGIDEEDDPPLQGCVYGAVLFVEGATTTVGDPTRLRSSLPFCHCGFWSAF